MKLYIQKNNFKIGRVQIGRVSLAKTKFNSVLFEIGRVQACKSPNLKNIARITEAQLFFKIFLFENILKKYFLKKYF
jgi:hypothetical protein